MKIVLNTGVFILYSVSEFILVLSQGYFIEVDVQYPKNLHSLENDLLKMKFEKLEKFVANLHDKDDMSYT